MQVGAALAVYAAVCVPGCDTAMAVPKQANELLATVHQHAGLLLQTASHTQVMISASYRFALLSHMTHLQLLLQLQSMSMLGFCCRHPVR